MVKFDAATLGTPTHTWNADPRMKRLEPLSLDGFSELVVIAAHPDDETLGAGGLIATMGERGIPVTVIIATDGAASHPGLSADSRQSLRDRRRLEVTEAVATLNREATLLTFGLPDGETREHRAELKALLQEQFGDASASTLIAAPWRGDGHRDHRIVGEVASEIGSELGFTVIEYPIWMWHWGQPEDAEIPWSRMAMIELDTALLGRKLDAIERFPSQIEAPDAASTPVLREDFLAHFRLPQEVFITDPIETDRAVTLEASYFDGLYARRGDPWHLATRWYERRKRATTMAALPLERYRSALEIGCSIGMLTADLAERCDQVLAIDLADAALAQARERLRGNPRVTFAQADIATGFPPGMFDLIVVSEVGYYLSPEALRQVVASATRQLEEGGTLVICHWRHPVADYPLSGDDVHDIVWETTSLTRTVFHDEDDFLLEVYGHQPVSVAQREGLVP